LVALTVTVFEITVPAAVPAVTCTTRTIVPLEPAGAAGAEQLIAPVPPTGGVLQVVPGGEESDTKVVFGGVISLSVGFTAVAGPTLVEVCV
jgi:hypothetical protein